MYCLFKLLAFLWEHGTIWPRVEGGLSTANDHPHPMPMADPIEVSDTAPAPADEAAVEEDAAAAKKREENRKKRERLKKKKAAEKETAADKESPAAEQGRWALGKLPAGRAERRDAGGGTRGLGVYALEGLSKSDVVAAAPPALSCIFDNAVERVCAFCFDEPKPGATTDHTVPLCTSELGGFGLKLDDYTPSPSGGATGETIITMVTKDSPNSAHVRIGDRIVSIDGQPVNGGHETAVPMLQAGAARGGGTVECVVRRPALLVCPGCKRLACCAKCVGEGRMAWHAYECALYRNLPPQALKGETATLRLLLRYKVASEPKIGDWPSSVKEPVQLLTSLQGNACDVPVEQLSQLSKLTGVSAANVASLIYQVRTNACEISRGGKKVGCALSVLMGWHNHDCCPNAQSTIAENGSVTLRTLKDVKEGDEVTISCKPASGSLTHRMCSHLPTLFSLVVQPLTPADVDPTLPFEERRKSLLAHYGFDCKCMKCNTEQRKELKNRMHQRDAYMQAQRR